MEQKPEYPSLPPSAPTERSSGGSVRLTSFTQSLMEEPNNGGPTESASGSLISYGA